MRSFVGRCLLLLLVAWPGMALARDGLLPFFDTNDAGASDPSPPPPQLTPFDRAVLEVCGNWGSTPTASRFRAMLDEPALAAGVAAMATLAMPRADLDHFKDRLTRAWFAAGGFEHVFCGQPGRRTVGGLHFAPRYLELQEEGLAGRLPPAACNRTEIVPPIYTIGMVYALPGSPGRFRACPKGYALGVDAATLLASGLKALLAEGRDGMCLAPLRTDDGTALQAVFVARRGAIRTFYPDATPHCSSGSQNGTCRCGG
ncbi:EndoU nuclease [Arboricoccus pini]|uniref:EndoU nuclease n=1 Tax=Arboricoccus pini TaxID=1963835 RepID=A0A212PZI3_9PROT|nr:EndoU domain-containing protein [Arboricoccus pini]SNB52440.1 EndoU nuclease [Arboricoccus pini]